MNESSQREKDNAIRQKLEKIINNRECNFGDKSCGKEPMNWTANVP